MLAAEVADPARTYTLRVTLLTPELEALAQAWTPEALAVLDLDGHGWRVEARATHAEEHPWAGSASYEQLAASLLERPAELPTRWELLFAAPVTFRRRGVNMPLPMPELVFGSLLEIGVTQLRRFTASGSHARSADRIAV